MATSSSKNMKISTFGSTSSDGGRKMSGKTGPAAGSSAVSPADAETAAGVHIPFIKSKDNNKQLPTYAAALQRSADDLLAAEDLDNIQLELETLLSNVALRYRVLKSEYEILDKDEKRNERRTKHAPGGGSSETATAAASSSGKRKRDDTAPVRKPKNTPSSLKHAKHTKNSPIAQHTDDSMDYTPQSGGLHGHGQPRDSHHHLQKMALPKNDTPNKFWLSVEPYCMPLTNEDLRLLDDLLEQYSGPLVPPIPELGPHYSSVWAAEDLKELQQNSNPNTNSNRLKQQNNATPTAMLKKADTMIDECVTGPLTQRLVSALMEEQLIQNPGDLAAIAESSNSSSENTHSSSQQLNFRSMSMLRNCIGIEKRVKKELIEQGILDINDFPNNDEDEIHAEIKRHIAELSSIAEHNSASLKRLNESATEEIRRLEIKRKLDTIDQEILEAYKRTMQNKVKRKPISAEEQREIFRLTSEQKTLSDQLERLQGNCFLYE